MIPNVSIELIDYLSYVNFLFWVPILYLHQPHSQIYIFSLLLLLRNLVYIFYWRDIDVMIVVDLHSCISCWEEKWRLKIVQFKKKIKEEKKCEKEKCILKNCIKRRCFCNRDVCIEMLLLEYLLIYGAE